MASPQVVSHIDRTGNLSTTGIYNMNFGELTNEDREEIINLIINNFAYADLRKLGFPAIPPDKKGKFPESFHNFAFTGECENNVEMTISHVIDLSNISLGARIDFLNWPNDINIDEENEKLHNFGNINMYVRGYNNGIDMFLTDAIEMAVEDFTTKYIPIIFITNENIFLVQKVEQKIENNEVIYDRFDLAPIMLLNYYTSTNEPINENNAKIEFNKIKINSAKLQSWIFHKKQNVIYCKIDSKYGSSKFPIPTLEDEGKILKVINGNWDIGEIY